MQSSATVDRTGTMDYRPCIAVWHQKAVMLVLGLKAKFCGLGLAIGWPWDCGLGIRGVILLISMYHVSDERCY